MSLSNKTYDIMKWVIIRFMPALILLISSLGKIYDFAELATTINLTLGAIEVFLGSILNISTRNYNKGFEEAIEEEE